VHFAEWRALRGRFFTPWPPAAALSAVGGVIAQVPRGGIRPFGDLTTTAHQLALVLVPCQAAEPTPTNLGSQKVAESERWRAEEAHWAQNLTGSGFDLRPETEVTKLRMARRT
jgi:hypothetical protein